MSQPREFVSEPFEFQRGAVLTVEAHDPGQRGQGVVEFSLESSEDKTYWAQVAAGTVSSGHRYQIPCKDSLAPWGRLRLRCTREEVRVRLEGQSGGCE